MVSIGIVPKVRFLWDCLWPGTSANVFFFNFQDFLWNDWFFFFFFFSVHKYVHPWWMVVICSFPLIQFSFHYIYFFSKRRIYVNSKSETTDVWCDVLVPSLCAICWHGVPYSKCVLVLEGEQSHFVVVPLLKQTDGKRAVRKSLEATRTGPFLFCHDVWEGNPNNESTWQPRSWGVRDAIVLLSGKCLWLCCLFRKRRLNILDVQPCSTITAVGMGDL